MLHKYTQNTQIIPYWPPSLTHMKLSTSLLSMASKRIQKFEHIQQVILEHLEPFKNFTNLIEHHK